MKCLNRISQFCSTLQYYSLSRAEKCLGTLSKRHQKLISVLELIRIEEYIPACSFGMGRPKKDRQAMARAFIAKSIFRASTTRELIIKLQYDDQLRAICGWWDARGCAL